MKNMHYLELPENSAGQVVNLYYNDYGQGKPVILIHGWPMSHEMWEYQVNHLVRAGNRVIAYDRRGFGKSSQPGDGYDYDTLADDLKALIDQLGLEDITLVGFSMGGGEVVRYFSRHGGKGVVKAVLISAITPSMLKSDTNPNGVEQAAFEGMGAQIQKDRISFLEDFGKNFFGVSILSSPISSVSLDYYRSLCAKASPKATMECLFSFSQTDFTDEMEKVTVPTLLIHGDSDKIVPLLATSDRAHSALPHSQFIIYEGAPHGLFYTDQNKLNQDLINFIASGSDGQYSEKQLTYELAH